jgi:hypothetical protein
MQTNSTSPHAKQKQQHLHGAALVDDKGKETPITEKMIQESLKDLLHTTGKK